MKIPEPEGMCPQIATIHAIITSFEGVNRFYSFLKKEKFSKDQLILNCLKIYLS